jgi:hypothetical protein
MEIAITGAGSVVIRYIDSTGQTLLQETLTVNGSPTVQGRRIIPLEIGTMAGRMPVAPVVIGQSNPRQRVTFDGVPHGQFTKAQCGKIGVKPAAARKAGRGQADPVGPQVTATGDAAMGKIIEAVGSAVRNTGRRK